MTVPYDPDLVSKAMTDPRWAGLLRVDTDLATVSHWDPVLLRDVRLLVPVDVQALYVRAGSTEPMVRLEFDLTTVTGDPPPLPPPFEPGSPRTPGVHLHWAVPDALLRGTVTDPESGTTPAGNRLSLPAMPDRWTVLRVLLPEQGDVPLVRGWVLEADTARATPLEQWPHGSGSATPAGRALTPEALTGAAGGSLAWTAGYDATTNRMAFHDPLTDLDAVDRLGGPAGNQATYVIAGWWSKPELDPLDDVWQSASLDDRLQQLGWTLVTDAEGSSTATAGRVVEAERRASVGLGTATRFAGTRPATAKRTAAAERTVGTESLSASAYLPASNAFLTAGATIHSASLIGWPRCTLLHGFVTGVPVRGDVPADSRPDAKGLRAVLGTHGDDIAAALTAPGLRASTPAARRSVERLVSAFTGQLMPRLGAADGVADVEEHEHAGGFGSLPGGDGELERLRTGQGPATVRTGRAGRTKAAAERAIGAPDKASLRWAGRTRMSLVEASSFAVRDEVNRWATLDEAPVAPDAEVREVRRPAPRYRLALEPLLAVSGARRSLRHGGDGRFSPDGLLQCRWPSQVVQDMPNVLRGAELLPTLGNGAIPPEVGLVAREALMLSPYHAQWLARVAANRRGVDGSVTVARFAAEAALRFGRAGAYTGDSVAFLGLDPAAGLGDLRVTAARVADQLHRFSAFAGVDPDPVGVTTWSQPWVPLWLEWEVAADLAGELTGWTLGAVDLDPESAATAAPRVFTGRSMLTTGAAVTLASAVREWLLAEEARDQAGTGEADEQTEGRLSSVAAAVEHLDIVSATLDGLREALLGLPYAGGLVRSLAPDGTRMGPAPLGPPLLLRSGSLRVVRARLVDAFGRVVSVPVGDVALPARDEIPAEPGPPAEPARLRLRPRFTRPARWMFRLVDAASIEPRPPEARVDEVDATQMVNPVAGWLLPDHIDEALEAFDTAGRPLGQLMHEPIGGGVTWEIAPGRSGPADAGPHYDLAAEQQAVGWFAAGLVAADAAARNGSVAAGESALSALLRAIDTTLWTVDPFAGLGTEHIAGLVGRPVAVVRARLWLEVSSDLSELDLSDPARRAEREQAYRELAEHAFPVRLGELTRADDGLLGYFVDDDYSAFHPVDRALSGLAFDSGRMRGQLGVYGRTPHPPASVPIDHAYVEQAGELTVHMGQVRTLTLLMHPAGTVHLTSGVLPRKSLALARDWVAPGLAAMSPSVRVGPVLIDPAQVRLPTVSALPRDQLFTRRDTPYTWRDDAILAATQSALLPDLPAAVQEGYIRVAPEPAPQEAP